MSQLKLYQNNSLNALKDFIKLCANSKNIKNSYSQSTNINFGREGIYNDAGFPDIPYVCLRLPTGGGKTILASYSIPLMCNEYLPRDFSLVIWFVPSTAILDQTYNCLIDKKHPYREILDERFNGCVRIMKVEDALYMSSKSDLKCNTNIIISTFASFRVGNKESRKVYDTNGSLNNHFENLSNDLKKRLKSTDENGVIKKSLSNLININNPIIIVDEAHNARTELSFEFLKRLNPACIIEFTATPKTKGNDRSNVLYNVSANSLKSEDMIKLPIELLTLKEWHNTVSDAVEKRNELEKIAAEEEINSGEYIRPIILIQAENDSIKQSTINLEEIYNYLCNELIISENEIAIVTGEKKGLDGVDLYERTCPVRYVITKQALKEGWDCPFAYVFCSVANVRSDKDAEQLLGRVLRLPYVRKKNRDELNRAYAFVRSDDFKATAENLADNLVNCGFQALEASSLIKIKNQQTDLGLFSSFITRTFSDIDKKIKLPLKIKDKIEINEKENKITFKETFDRNEKETLKKLFSNEEDKEILEEVFKVVNRIPEKTQSPCEKGEVFSLPQLMIEFDDELIIFDEDVLVQKGWNLSNCDYKIDENELNVKVDVGKKGLIDIDARGEPVIHSPEQIQEYLTNLYVTTSVNETKFITDLVRDCRHPSIPFTQAVEFIRKSIEYLVEIRKFTLEQLYFIKFRIRDLLKTKISIYYFEAKKKGYQELIFPYEKNSIAAQGEGRLKLGSEFKFPEIYPANNYYTGNKRFKKHYYSFTDRMNGEEEECAMVIDENNSVSTWIRNVDSNETYSFWLQTSTDKFYPDFIVKLKNGIYVIVEYKSSDRFTNDDSKEKRNIGAVYEYLSYGRVKFIMLKGKDWDNLKKVLSGMS